MGKMPIREPGTTGRIEGRTWGTEHRNGLVLESINPAWEKHIEIWVSVDGDGPSVCLTPKQAREVAAELVRRAHLIEGQC